MKMKKLLSKMLLVAMGLCAGSVSAWGETLNATVKMTYVNQSSPDTSYGEISEGNTAETGYNVLSGTYPNQTVGFGNTGWGVNFITYLQVDASALPAGTTITNATLTFSGSGSGASDKNRASVFGAGYNSSSWSNNLTYNTADKSIIPVGSTYTTSSQKYTTFETVTLNIMDAIKNDVDKIVTIIVYETAADHSYIKNPAVSITYTTETIYTATFNENNGLTPTITIYSDEARQTEIAYNQLSANTTYYYTATLAGYNNYEGSFKVGTSDPTVNFTMTAKTRYTFTINAVDASSNVIKALYTDNDSYEGKKQTMLYPKYLTDANKRVTYSKDNDTYGEEKTAKAENETYTISYTAYDGVAYFVEVEDVVSGSTAYSSWNCSNGRAVRGFTTAKDIFTIPATGTYDITYAACNNNVNYDLSCTLSKNSTEIATKDDLKSVSINFIKSNGIVSNSNISLNRGDVLKLTPSSTNGIVDYMLIELKELTAVPVTIGQYGYATFSSTYALDFTDVSGLTAYIVTGKSGDKVKMQSVTGDMAANTGLVLKGTPGTYDIPVVASSENYYNSTSTPKNYLFAINESYNLGVSNNGTNYVLSVQGEEGNKKVVFAPITSDVAPVTAGHAGLWLPTEIAGQARALNISFGDEASGISSIAAETLEKTAIFNLSGQRVSKPGKGLYIVNGKKVMK